MTRTRRSLLVAGAVLALALGAYELWQSRPADWFGAASQPVRVTVSGNIEAHESVLSFAQVQAPIVALPFDEGASVKRGTVLARLDDRLYRQQIEIDRSNQQVAAAQVAVSESNLAATRHTVANDVLDLTQKQQDYARAETLVKSAAVSVQTRDQLRTAAQQAASTLARDQDMVQVADNNVKLAKANEAAAAAKLGLDAITLQYATLTAPYDGVIAVREAELGQLAGPGVAIVTLADLDHPWLRAYVNEQDLGKVRLGEAVDVTTDTYPGKVYRGRISFISPTAEFTPKTVETHAERVTLVYRIRIDIANPTHELLAGMPADATIGLLPPGP